MATHKSAIKRHRQNLKRRARNVAVASAIKTAVKQVKETTAKGNKENALTSLAKAVRLLDKAVSKKTLHRNNASRKISRLTAVVNSITAK
ncbi:MAG: 30S ribosomal protein S20 [Deltaproteobacteria bacterium]|nr:30S ribosomal protein S20 [Deltaproteobacteria bacterium]